MGKITTNIGQNECSPIATKNNIRQQDGLTYGMDDPKQNLINAYKCNLNYINNISLESTNFPIYAYMFNKSFCTINDSDITFFDNVVIKMKEATEPLIFQYVETTENENGLEVFPKFMEFLFFMNVLWVGYDTEEEKFYLLSKLAPEDKKDNKYINLLNAKTVVLPTEEPIKCMGDGRDNAHFENGFKVCYNCITRDIMIQKLGFVNTKRLKITSDSKQNIDDVEHQLSNTNPYITIVEHNTMTEPLESVDSNSLDTAVTTHYVVGDREISELGRIMNVNDKTGERKTTGENGKDTYGIICRQQATLSQLKLFGKKLEKIKNIKLEFKVLEAIDKTIDETLMNNMTPNPESGQKQKNTPQYKQPK